MTSITPVTLANCEDEPIHVPGAIQPHGALIALRADGMVLAASENIQALLGFVASPGSYLTQEQVGPEVLRTSTAAAVALGALGVLPPRWVGAGTTLGPTAPEHGK